METFQNQNATENGDRMGTKIHHNRNKKQKHRIQTIHNWTQLKKIYNEINRKKQLKNKKNI